MLQLVRGRPRETKWEFLMLTLVWRRPRKANGDESFRFSYLGKKEAKQQQQKIDGMRRSNPRSACTRSIALPLSHCLLYTSDAADE